MIRANLSAYKAFAITAGAGELDRPPTYGLLVCATGNLTMKVDDGDGGEVTVTMTSVPVGTHIPLVPTKVTAATATVVGLF
jgi:hypothetical protein